MLNFIKSGFIKNLLSRIKPGKANDSEQNQANGDDKICCSDKIIIAYRGLSDLKQYVAYERHYKDLRYFKQSNLKVFCSVCRQRLYFED